VSSILTLVESSDEVHSTANIIKIGFVQLGESIPCRRDGKAGKNLRDWSLYDEIRSEDFNQFLHRFVAVNGDFELVLPPPCVKSNLVKLEYFLNDLLPIAAFHRNGKQEAELQGPFVLGRDSNRETTFAINQASKPSFPV